MFCNVSLTNSEYQSKIEKSLCEYDEFFNMSIDEKEIIIFTAPTKKIFDAITCNTKESVVGKSDGENRRIFVVSHEDIKNKYNKNSYIKLLKHEIVHIYIDAFCLNNKYVPTWLHEGSAVYLSGQIDDQIYCRLINTLFDNDPEPFLFYTAGGLFIKYLVETYKKEKLLEFLTLLRKIKSGKEVNKCFLKVYGKTSKAMLKEMCLKNQLFEGKFTLSLFKKGLEKKVNECKQEYGKFFNEDFNKINISIKGILDKKKFCEMHELKNNCNMTYPDMAFSILKDNTIVTYAYDPMKCYYKKEVYFQSIFYEVGQIILFNFCGKNKNIPLWLSCGFGCYFSGGLKGNICTKKIEELFDEGKNLAFIKIAGGFFIKYLIENYSKEKFLEFLESFREIKNKEQVEESFIKIYGKTLKEMIRLIL